jgi:F-type H+-transporting ATPase subunit b
MLDTLLTIAAATAAEGHGPIADLAGKFHVEWNILVAQIINFTIVAFLLYRFAFKPIIATIDQRQKQIADGLQYAEEVKLKLADVERQQAETLKEASLEAQKTVGDARSQAKQHLENQKAEAQAQAEDLIRKGREAIELERTKMIIEAKEEIAKLVVMTAEKVLDRELSAQERSAFSEAAVKEVNSGN